MEDGGVFIIVAPPDPFRCPPGPYERASLVAYYFKQFKPRAKILILDAKDTFFEQDLFEDGWNRHYPGMIEWLPGQFTGGIKSVDVKTRAIRTAGETFNASVANIIPAQIAGELAQRAGLADQSGWCPIDPMTFELKLQPGTHVIGDAASAGEMPKSAFTANSQAKACAFAIAAALTGSEHIAPHLFNTCFTLLAPNDAVSDAIDLKPRPDRSRSPTSSLVSGRKRRGAAPSGTPSGRLVRCIHPRRFRVIRGRSAPLDHGTERHRKANAAPGGLRVRRSLQKPR